MVSDRSGRSVVTPKLVDEFGGAELVWVGEVVQSCGIEGSDVGDVGEKGECVGEVGGGEVGVLDWTSV